jgi:predicted ATPase
MLALIEALRFRSLAYVRQPLGRFHVLVGPNASGKTTFLDVPALLGRLVSDGLDAAIRDRTQSFEDLVWRRSGRSFELGLEARIPDERRHLLDTEAYDTIRYEVALGLHPHTDELSIMSERALLKCASPPQPRQSNMFPEPPPPPRTILTPKLKGAKTVVNKVPDGNDNFFAETGKGWRRSTRASTRHSCVFACC